MRTTVSPFVEIEASGWPQPLEANVDLLRAAISGGMGYGGMGQKIYKLRITRPDRWEIFSVRHKRGWVVNRGIIGGPEMYRAVPHGSARAGMTIARLRLLATFRLDTIDAETTEELMRDFLKGNTAPAGTAWMRVIS